MAGSRESAKIRKIGNGRGVLLSKPLCNLLGMEVEDTFRVEIDNGKLILVPVQEGE